MRGVLQPLRDMPRAIWVLGFVSMFMDISSEMIHSVLPLFMVTVLGTSATVVGAIEGAAEATALVVKVFSGVLSDYFGKRKWLAVIGYGLGALTQPVFALAHSSGWVLAARLTDRVGKGIRGAPRDALVADLTPQAMRGAAYGLRQTLDTVGAFAGPLVATALLLAWSGQFQVVFWVAVVPAFVAVALLALGVRDPDRPVAEGPAGPRAVNPISRDQLRKLDRSFWWVMGIGALLSMARFSEAFLVLQAEHVGLAVSWVPLVMVVMNLAYAVCAYPFGHWSDKFNRSHLLVLGCGVLIGSDLVLASASHWGTLMLGVSLWGVQMGVTQGLLSAMVADAAPAELRGTAFGLFSLFSGLSLLVSSVLAGLLWDRVGPGATFVAGAAFAALTAMVALMSASRIAVMRS